MKRRKVQVGFNKETPLSRIYLLEIKEAVRRMQQKKEKIKDNPTQDWLHNLWSPVKNKIVLKL